MLNISQSDFTVEKLNKLAENQNIEIELSNGEMKKYKIGDRKFTDVCDYMDNCEYTCSPTATIGESDIVSHTYTNEFANMNNIRIIERIRMLFKDRHFYKREELIKAINIVKQYPVEQIYSAITFFVKNNTELLADKYGRLGRLVDKSHNDEAYYVFQPVEITDTNASIYERSTPVDYKHAQLSLEIKPDFETLQSQQSIQYPRYYASIMTNNTLDQDKEEYMKFFVKFNEQMKDVYSEIREIPEAQKEWTWYMHARTVHQHIHHVIGIPEDTLKQYFIYHMLDQLLFYQKMVFVRVLYSTAQWEPLTMSIELQKIERDIKSYFDKIRMSKPRAGNTINAILLNKDNTWQIEVQSLEDKYSWSEGQSTDKTFFKNEILDHAVSFDKLNNYVGFFSLFKNSEMVFYVKDMTKARNMGARCDSAGKVNIIKILNDIVTTQKYTPELTKSISQLGLCVILEMVMRFKTNQSKGAKYWMLKPEEAALIAIKEVDISKHVKLNK